MNELDDAIQPNGNLFNVSWYLQWLRGDNYAILNGDFTAAQLRAIADYMDKGLTR